MVDYDFHALLEPLEFEKLVCDIIQARDNIYLETYKEGRDSGIDGSFTDKNKKKTIVQAKRYKKDAFNRLYRDLEQIELPKVRKLKPERYILGVSIDFSPPEKEKIVKLFEGYIVTTDDVLSSRDMNRIIKDPKYNWIELAFPKLWLPSINVFKKVLNESVHRAIYRESTEELKQALQTSKVFVPTNVYRKALHKSSQSNVVILSGEPGVGKTTMAYLLALAHLQPDDLDGFIWANSIHDVYTMFDDEKKQVIILDDFWGSIFHDEHTRRNDENRLNKLIRRIVESKGKKRLILTTREYVLQQGLQKQPALKETLQEYALICTIEEYGYDEKASILFRHLYASSLEYEYVEYLYLKCDWIVNHKNYNPRVLALFLNKEPSTNCTPEDYYIELCDYFDNPGTFWESIFVELSQEAQIVAMLLLISSTPMRLSDMESCYLKYIHDCTHERNVKNLGACIAELEKTMIKSFYSEEEEAILIKFNLPAVQDFLYMYMKKNSEQYIPLILKCCAFYNQFQFLLEYCSRYCSNPVKDLIVQQCILNYHDYKDSTMEYDGSWNWDSDDNISYRKEHLHRFFHLIRCCELKEHPSLFYFLESQIKNYCLTMGEGDLEAQYTDLHNLPDIIERCIKKGMTFNGKEIIDKYYEEAFSVYHYRAMRQFQEVFPEEYSLFNNTYYQKIKREIKSTILSELEFLEDWCMDAEFDMLIDDIPDLLQDFGLPYTKQFEQQVFSLCGRKPLSVDREKVAYNLTSNNDIDWEEQALEVVKKEAKSWLLGFNETQLIEEQINEIISKSNLTPSVKKELLKVLDTGTPQYVFDFLQTMESIELLLSTLNGLEESHIPRQASTLFMMMLWHIGQGNHELITDLIVFFAECFMIIMHREDPVLRADKFLSSEVYAYYLKDNMQLREIVFGNMIKRDEQWIRFLHIPLFIFCNVFIINKEYQDGELEEYYQNLWGDNFNKLKQITRYDWGHQIYIGYADFGTYHFKRYDWEECMYRVWEELAPFQFNKAYVEPMIKNYLNILGHGDDASKVLKHISYCRLQCEYNESGIACSLSYELSDELCLIESLAIAEGLDNFPRKITKSILKRLQKNETICKKQAGKWNIFLYEVKDMDLLKRLGFYDEILRYVKEVESICSRFLNGDYSQIKRIP